MKKLTLAIVVLLATAVVAVDSNSAKADGFSIQFVGSGYGSHNGYSSYPYNSYYARGYGSYYGGYGGYYPRGGHTWHDTSHYDYHPGGFVRHYDHYDYVPGHYDYHEDGHWDHHHW